MTDAPTYTWREITANIIVSAEEIAKDPELHALIEREVLAYGGRVETVPKDG